MPSLLLLLLLDKAIKVAVVTVKGHTIKVTNGLLQERGRGKTERGNKVQ